MYNSRAIECAICKEHMTANDIYYTPCSHTFNYTCISEWLKSHNTCPQCRQPVFANQLRRMFINLSNDTTLQDELLNNQRRIAFLNLQVYKQNNEIMEYKAQLDFHKRKASEVNKKDNSLREQLDQVESRVIITRSGVRASKATAASKDPVALVALVAHLKSEMKANVAAERKKVQDTTKKLKLEHAKNLQLKKDLQTWKSENRVQQQKLREFEKCMPFSSALKKSQTLAKSSSTAVAPAKKQSSDAKVDSSNQHEPIATRTRSRTMR